MSRQVVMPTVCFSMVLSCMKRSLKSEVKDMKMLV